MRRTSGSRGGTHVFRDFADSEEGNAAKLDRYLERAINEALNDPGDDFFGSLVKAEFLGRSLTREEIMGFANLAFAGGRDTIIHLITNSLHYLAANPGALEQLREDPDLAKTATEEFLRYFSPPTHIGRVVAQPTMIHGHHLEVDDLVSLDRRPNRHVAFGHGPHTCLGAPHSRMIMTTVLEQIALRVAGMRVVQEDETVEELGSLERVAGYDSLLLELEPRTAG